MSEILSNFSSFVWGVPLMVLLVGTGLYLTYRLGLIQIRGFKHGRLTVTGEFDREDGHVGEISHFKALTTALSATIGTGNIVGVAAAILIGGPGAVFWMWVTAVVGMATKFASCTLSVHYRRIDENGEAHCGPMHFIEQGMGPRWKWLAVLFAFFTVTASFGIGNMFQVSSMTTAANALINGQGSEVTELFRWLIGLGVGALVASIIIGGIKRIASVTSWLVPIMCAIYIFGGFVILLSNIELILPGLKLIFTQAFVAPESVTGGLLGGVIRAGVARGLFSNEAGLGSAAMAHGAAKTNEPVREGLVAMLGPFIDTIIVCTITALVIICTGTHERVTVTAELTSAAFNAGLPGSGVIVLIGILLFAFSTLIAWSYYGDRAADYLFGKKAVLPYRLIYIGFIILGALRPLDDVINFCDAMNGLMAIPNLIALIILTPVVVKLTADYSKKYINK